MAKAAPAARERPTGAAVAPGTAAPVPVEEEAPPDVLAEPVALVPEAPDAAVPVPEAEAVPVVAVVKPDGVDPPEVGLATALLVPDVGVGT